MRKNAEHDKEYLYRDTDERDILGHRVENCPQKGAVAKGPQVPGEATDGLGHRTQHCGEWAEPTAGR